MKMAVILRVVVMMALVGLLVVVAAGVGAAPATAPLPTGSEDLPDGATDSTVIENMNVPIALAFDADGRLFYTEKTGAVRLFANGALQSAPVISFNVNANGEQGLLGIALDPAFGSNHLIYVYYTEPGPSGGDSTNKVVRFVENNGIGSNPTTIFTSPDKVSASNHNGGNIRFGPDGKLYITIGDDGDKPANSQDVSVKNGKIHRINPDGSMPSDNPVFKQINALPSLYAMGVRNSFDMTFDPVKGDMWASENGPGCDDELNHILPGGNYGWRTNYPCEDGNPDPAYNTVPAEWWLPASQCCVAPTGVDFYSNDKLPGWQNTLLMCDYNTGNMRHFYLDDSRAHVIRVNYVNKVRCNMDVQTAPDGSLYYMAGGGYSPGALHRISVAAAAATATPIAPTATRVPPTATAPAATAVPSTAAPTQPGQLISTADSLFYNVWERVDRPVLEGSASRSWTWGPKGGQSLQEPYGDGKRLVQYFDKARMELNPASNGTAAYVTNGLLVVEMISGRVQVGPTSYEAHAAATLPIGGDGANNPAPSYAALAKVASLNGENTVADRTDQVVTATIDHDGNAKATGAPQYAVRIAGYARETGHNIPDVFWAFLNQEGTVYEGGQNKQGKIFDWVFTVGYPLTEPYWTTMAVGNRVQDVLVQAYQRQVLTFIPGYSAQWQVQFGNVGQHYFGWRYGAQP